MNPQEMRLYIQDKEQEITELQQQLQAKNEICEHMGDNLKALRSANRQLLEQLKLAKKEIEKCCGHYKTADLPSHEKAVALKDFSIHGCGKSGKKPN